VLAVGAGAELQATNSNNPARLKARRCQRRNGRTFNMFEYSGKTS
jgi:hypothetical protein